MTAPAPLTDRNSWMLIGRVNGKSSSRRQRRYRDLGLAEVAADRWARRGHTVFWLYGPATDAEPYRPLLRHWHPAEGAACTHQLDPAEEPPR